MKLAFPSENTSTVPVLILAGEKDPDAAVDTHAWPQYHQTTASKLIFVVAGGDHYCTNGPAGGTEREANVGLGECCALCNITTVCFCGSCCPMSMWCQPCSDGTLKGPTGHATNHSPRGAIGGMALAWLQLFLLDDERARSQLVLRPDIASGFEHSGITGSTTASMKPTTALV